VSTSGAAPRRLVAQARDELVAAGRELERSGLNIGTAGNISTRVDDNVVITPRRATLGTLAAGQCCVVSTSGEVIKSWGDGPSSETPLHCAIYRATECGAVVHTHSHFATVVSTLVDALPGIHYMVATLGGPIRVAAYAPFGSHELATLAVAGIADRQAVLLRNHGAVVIADSIHVALRRAQLLEWLCSVYVHARSAGDPKILDEDVLMQVAARSQTLRYAS
jgi:L-fuculose-phosphate aldolase